MDWKELFAPEIVWLIVGVAFFLAEMMLPGFVIFFFAVGALVTALACLIGAPNLNMQLLIFLAASLISLFALRKWMTGIFSGRKSSSKATSESLDSIISEKAVVTETVTPEQPGKVELHGTVWKAEADETLETGTRVKVIGHESLTLKVTRL